MPVFRNKNWTERNYECTNVVAAKASHTPKHGFSGQPMPDAWELADKSLLTDLGLVQLGSCGDVEFWGYM